MPSRACRRFVRRLSEQADIPVYAFVDCDPYGIANIYRSLKVGSGNAAHVNHLFCVPKAALLGVTPEDIKKYKLPTHPLKEIDIKRANDALENDPFFKAHPRWQKAINGLLKMGACRATGARTMGSELRDGGVPPREARRPEEVSPLEQAARFACKLTAFPEQGFGLVGELVVHLAEAEVQVAGLDLCEGQADVLAEAEPDGLPVLAVHIEVVPEPPVFFLELLSVAALGAQRCVEVFGDHPRLDHTAQHGPGRFAVCRRCVRVDELIAIARRPPRACEPSRRGDARTRR